MKEFSLRLVEGFQKPVVRLYGVNVLIDTGADIPVCYHPERYLEKAFHTKLVATDVGIGTFGDMVYGNVYAVDKFVVGELSYPGLKFFAPNTDRISEYHFILSATMFDRLIYEIDKKNDILTIRIPDDEPCERRIRILDKEGKEHVLSAEGQGHT